MEYGEPTGKVNPGSHVSRSCPATTAVSVSVSLVTCYDFPVRPWSIPRSALLSGARVSPSSLAHPAKSLMAQSLIRNLMPSRYLGLSHGDDLWSDQGPENGVQKGREMSHQATRFVLVHQSRKEERIFCVSSRSRSRASHCQSTDSVTLTAAVDSWAAVDRCLVIQASMHAE